MLLLASIAEGTIARYEHPNVARLVQPRNYDQRVGERVWAADNDAFTGFDPVAFTRMLDRLADKPRCLWVACPDVVGDAAATFEMFKEWQPRIARYGFPVAFVGQDGLTEDMIPWSRMRCLFIGGSTEWKLGLDAAHFAREAKRRGKWVHMGRVNTLRRIRYAQSLGCDSVDGTSYVRFRDTYLPKFLAYVEQGDQLGFDFGA